MSLISSRHSRTFRIHSGSVEAHGINKLNDRRHEWRERSESLISCDRRRLAILPSEWTLISTAISSACLFPHRVAIRGRGPFRFFSLCSFLIFHRNVTGVRKKDWLDAEIQGANWQKGKGEKKRRRRKRWKKKRSTLFRRNPRMPCVRRVLWYLSTFCAKHEIDMHIIESRKEKGWKVQLTRINLND